jgi:ribosomal protein S18 acetylase RimI-like enzyme
MTAGWEWRPMRAADLDAVEAIAAIVHPRFPEDRAVFAERLSLYPDGAGLLVVEGTPAGYVLAHPWRARSFPPLDSLLDALPENAESLYIHDLALLPTARGLKAGVFVVLTLLARAKAAGFARTSLVAVNGSVPFWSQLGFRVVDDASLVPRLSHYEPDARFMEQVL